MALQGCHIGAGTFRLDLFIHLYCSQNSMVWCGWRVEAKMQVQTQVQLP
jgi:hypothetical protein